MQSSQYYPPQKGHCHARIIAMLLVAVAALRLGVPEKARSIATFGW